jgi:hypothetical protein
MSVVEPALNHNSVVLSIGTFAKSKSQKCLVLLSGLLFRQLAGNRIWSTEMIENQALVLSQTVEL